MTKRQAILNRLRRLEEALQKANEYLATGEHRNWYGFRPLLDNRGDRPPHPDWVANVFVRRRLGAVSRCDAALEILDRKTKERRINQRRKGIN